MDKVMDENVVQYSDLKEIDLSRKLTKFARLTISLSPKQAKRIQNDWDKFGAYKVSYAHGKKKKGLWLSLVWIFNNIYTSLFYGDIEKVTALYYDHYKKLQPVNISNSDENVLVTFQVRNHFI
jgi:hypothetical protein